MKVKPEIIAWQKTGSFCLALTFLIFFWKSFLNHVNKEKACKKMGTVPV